MTKRSIVQLQAKKMDTGLAMQGRVEDGVMAQKRYEFLKNLLQTYRAHSWTNATVGAIGRSIIGAGFKIVPLNDDVSPRLKDIKRAEAFFSQTQRSWNNIKDSVSLYAKLYQLVGSFRLFGQIGLEIIRNGKGDPIGFDVVSGFVMPNVDKQGYFKTPAYYVKPWGGGEIVAYEMDEFVYLYDPGLSGSIYGETVYESLTHTTIPADLHAAVSYRQLFENVNSPYNGVWQIEAGTSDEDFDYFLELLEQRYSGSMNYGANPLVVRGGASFVQTKSRNSEDAPYLEGRRYNQEEISAVTGVDSNKLGMTDASNKANMRESRREYHENALRPMYALLEDLIYHQVFRRVLDIDTLKLEFGRPDFATALEQATIDARYLSNGVYSPNEIRIRQGDSPREGGDVYYEPMNMGRSGPDADEQPVNTGDPSTAPTRPVRAPRDEEEITNALDEVASWRRFAVRVASGKRPAKDFETKHVPASLCLVIKSLLSENPGDVEYVKAVMDVARDIIKDDAIDLQQSR